MKRFLLVVMVCLLACCFAGAAPAQASLVRVKATHPRPQHHHAHKATKHRAPKRHHHHTV